MGVGRVVLTLGFEDRIFVVDAFVEEDENKGRRVMGGEYGSC